MCTVAIPGGYGSVVAVRVRCWSGHTGQCPRTSMAGPVSPTRPYLGQSAQADGPSSPYPGQPPGAVRGKALAHLLADAPWPAESADGLEVGAHVVWNREGPPRESDCRRVSGFSFIASEASTDRRQLPPARERILDLALETLCAAARSR